MNFDSLTHRDVFNLALQRTETLFVLPIRSGVSPSYLAWHKLGLDFILSAEIFLRKNSIIGQCEREILAEVGLLAEGLKSDNPKSLVDIGPGLGIHDAALALELGLEKLLLIDIEESDSRHHGFEDEGAGYNSLAATKCFIEAQGFSGELDTINPKKADLSSYYGQEYDVIMSLLSCGFHYPAETYLDFYLQCLNEENGKLILDIRRDAERGALFEHFSVVKTIEVGLKHDRLLLMRKAKA